MQFSVFAPELERIETALTKVLGEPQYQALAPLWKSMSYSLNSGGKRFRPVLSLLTAKALKKSSEQVLPIALAVEMIHTYSLIHDDLPMLDNDDMRRGQPSNHKVFGDALALLAGDGLLTAAFGVLAQSQSHQVGRALAELAKAAGPAGMVGGQVMDIAVANSNEVSVEHLKNIHELKTGALIAVSVSGAALLCEAKPEELKSLTHFGQLLGFAFQLADDIQDHKDDRPEKVSYTAKLGKAQTLKLLEQTSQQALAELNSFGAEADGLRQMVQFNLSRI